MDGDAIREVVAREGAIRLLELRGWLMRDLPIVERRRSTAMTREEGTPVARPGTSGE